MGIIVFVLFSHLLWLEPPLLRLPPLLNPPLRPELDELRLDEPKLLRLELDELRLEEPKLLRLELLLLRDGELRLVRAWLLWSRVEVLNPRLDEPRRPVLPVLLVLLPVRAVPAVRLSAMLLGLA